MQHKYRFPEDSYILIGTVAKPQGLHGEVNIHAFSGQPENFKEYDTLYLVDSKGEISPKLVIKRFRVQKGKAVVLFDRVSDRTHAERLTGMGVLVAKSDLPELGKDEFYWHQLVGLQVHTVDGRDLGTLSSIFSNGAQDVMVIQGDNDEYLVPMTDGILNTYDETTVVIDPPPGLLDINTDEDEDLFGSNK